MKSRNINETILKAIEDSCLNSFGVRVMTDNPVIAEALTLEVGDSVNNSHVWVDGESSDEQLEGVSAITIGYDEFDVEDILYDLEQLRPYRDLGDQIVLIGGDDSYEGNDPNETVISNAQVLHIF